MARSLFAICLGFCVLATAAATACSSGDVAVGSSNKKLMRRDDGGATGDGRTCSWDDTVSSDGTYTPTPNGPYKVGDRFPAPDGCNTCECADQGIFCTEKGCPPGPPLGVDGGDGGGVVCKYYGHEWRPGEKIPQLDGCNFYGCQDDGTLTNTEIACTYECPAATTIDCEPIVPEERLALCYGPKHDWIAANCPGVSFGL